MSELGLRTRPDTYVDSVQLMAVTRTMLEQPGVGWAAAVMGTPANLAKLADEGFGAGRLGDVAANDLALAVRAGTRQEADGALAAGMGALAEAAPAPAGPQEPTPPTLGAAVAAMGGANVALISVPGPFAALEAHKALSAGLHVLVFSDNVPMADEVELKTRGEELGLLVMGPGAGTGVLGGVGLGFANRLRRGPVGVVAAAGTGAQEVMTLVDRWGSGVSQVIGVGGRDLNEELGARMTRLAVAALEADPATEVLVVVSKPPAPAVARSLLAGLGGKPTVAALVGLDDPPPAPPRVRLVGTLEEAAAAAGGRLGMPAPPPGAGLAGPVARAAAGLGPGRGAVRGLFSGGTLCYEAMVLLSRELGPVHSNVPLRPAWGMPAPDGAHVCLDLGEEEHTRGRPHPMIDPEARVAQIRRQADDASTAVILLDVVLGHGAHPDPASVLAPACADAAGRPGGPVVVAYVLGTDADPQGLAGQRGQLAEAGCLLAPTGARAALMAAAVSRGRPAVAEARLP
ncbi:MAG TPA: protein FdrA [Actinomycetota bacterium]|nr:protein FdrA [Actinomycetota bacterium]